MSGLFGGNGGGAGAPPQVDPNEQEARRRLALLRRMKKGRGSTLLTGSLGSDSSVVTQTILGN